jgi:hypothetical protein
MRFLRMTNFGTVTNEAQYKPEIMVTPFSQPERIVGDLTCNG